ncbi:MAG: DUF4149 domain-containing protein [Candidatus Methylomirabilales bacterium]
MRRTLLILLASGVGTWLGVMVFLSFVVAPSAFAILESRHQAGDLVAATLNVLYLSAYILGPLLVLVSIAVRPLGRRLLWGLRTILLILMTASTLISREIVGTRLFSLLRAMGTAIQSIPPGDPLRLQFQQWHQFSVLLMLFNIAAAAVVLCILSVEAFREGQG